MKTFLISLIILSQISIADEGVIYLPKETPAPYTGFLFTQEKTKEVRIGLIDRDTYKTLNESLNKTIEMCKDNASIQEKKVNILLTQNDKLSQDLYSARQTSTWENTLWFFGGVVLTGLIFYGTSQAYKQ